MIVFQGKYINLGQQLMIKTTNNVKKWNGDVANFRNSHTAFLTYFIGVLRSQLNIHDDAFFGFSIRPCIYHYFWKHCLKLGVAIFE